MSHSSVEKFEKIYVSDVMFHVPINILKKFKDIHKTGNIWTDVQTIEEDPVIFQAMLNFLNDPRNKFPAKWDHRLKYWGISFEPGDLIFENIVECERYPILISDTLCNYLKLTFIDVPKGAISYKYIDMVVWIYPFDKLVVVNPTAFMPDLIFTDMYCIVNLNILNPRTTKIVPTYTNFQEPHKSEHIRNYGRVHALLSRIQIKCDHCTHYHLNL